MKKNKLVMVLSAVSVIGLAACNYQNDNELDNNNGEISNISTNLSSQNYPHTRAILTQDAKYRSMPVNRTRNGYGYRRPQENELQGFDKIQPEQGLVPQQAPMEQPRVVPEQEPTQQQMPVPQQEPINQQAPTQQQPQTAQVPTQQPNLADQAPTSISQAAQKVIDLTNAERSKNGLPGLTLDNQLCGVAQKKSVDMQQNNYFSHTSPTYGSPFDMMRDFGVTYNSAGENIAQGQQTPQAVVQAWMNSEGHRKNILSNSFTHIGVGYEQNGNHWTQMFIGK